MGNSHPELNRSESRIEILKRNIRNKNTLEFKEYQEVKSITQNKRLEKCVRKESSCLSFGSQLNQNSSNNIIDLSLGDSSPLLRSDVLYKTLARDLRKYISKDFN